MSTAIIYYSEHHGNTKKLSDPLSWSEESQRDIRRKLRSTRR